MTIVIRDARPADLDVIVRFNRAMAEESEGRMLDPGVLAAGVAAVLADAGKGRYFLAESDGAVIAQTMITYEWSDWRNGDFWWIQSVYVTAAHRGRGVFSQIYRHVHALARSAPAVAGLRLYVDRENRHAADVYRALGMQDAHYEMLEVDFSLGETKPSC